MRLVRATQPDSPHATPTTHRYVESGAGPRGLLSVLHAAKARALPGVVGVYAGADMESRSTAGIPGSAIGMNMMPGIKIPASYALASDKVRYGGDLIGQTLAPEVFLARELEMCYAALCYVVHYAEGIKERKAAPGKLMGGLIASKEKRRVEEAAGFIPKILSRLAQRLPKARTACDCKESMLFYKKQKRISNNWREWLNP